MTHINVILEQEARNFIAEFLKHATFISSAFDFADHVMIYEDTGEPFDLTHDANVGDFLNVIVGGNELGKTLRQVLEQALLIAAAKHVKQPAKMVERFLVHLRYRSLLKLLEEPDEAAQKKYEDAIRTEVARLGFSLRRSRTQDPLLDNYGRYHIVVASTGAPIIDAPFNLRGIKRWASDVREGRLIYE